MGSKKSKEENTYLVRGVMYQNYLDGFLDKIINNLKIEGEDIPDDIPNDFIIKKLIYHGCIGVFNKKTWLPVNATGYPDVYGVYSRFTLMGENGKIFTGNRDNTAVIRFTPTQRKLIDWLAIEINKLIDIDLSIYSNLINTRQTTILQSSDNTNTIELKKAFSQQALGVPVIIDGNKVFDNFKVHNTDVPLIVNELLQARSTIINDINVQLGIVGGINKRERVESFDLPINNAIDSIYVMIDTFNKDCEHFKIKAKMSLNGVVEDLYNKDNQDESEDNKQ